MVTFRAGTRAFPALKVFNALPYPCSTAGQPLPDHWSTSPSMHLQSTLDSPSLQHRIARKGDTNLFPRRMHRGVAHPSASPLPFYLHQKRETGNTKN